MEEKPEDLDYIKSEFPRAWAVWAEYAMKIPFCRLKEKDWYAEFFKEQGINYHGAPARSFKTLEDNIILLS